jgi:hypothetical protein
MSFSYYSSIFLWTLCAIGIATPIAQPIDTPVPGSIDPPSPEECPMAVYPRWNVTKFLWYNGSNSLDCSRPEDQALLFCPDNLYPIDTCPGRPHVSPCSAVGLPGYVPYGFTPTPTLSMDVANGESCYSGTDPLYPSAIGRVGNGQIDCGYMPSRDGFGVYLWGTTNLASSTANITYSPQRSWYPCRNYTQNNYTYITNIQYYGEATFNLKCEHDEFFNATCTADPFEIPITSWKILE